MRQTNVLEAFYQPPCSLEKELVEERSANNVGTILFTKTIMFVFGKEEKEWRLVGRVGYYSCFMMNYPLLSRFLGGYTI